MIDEIEFGKRWKEMAKKEGHRKKHPNWKPNGGASEYHKDKQQSSQSKILRFLELSPHEWFSVRDIADAVGRSSTGIKGVLDNMHCRHQVHRDRRAFQRDSGRRTMVCYRHRGVGQ